MLTSRQILASVLVAAGLLAASACGVVDTQVGEKSRAQKANSSGLEGAMCAEHGVLEAVCTKCNPKLIAVFRAKADFCEEHGFPESFCPTCHPERGGKPSTDVRDDGAPADGTRVRFQKQNTAVLAGIETAKATVRLSSTAVVAPARVAYDATKLAQVNARASGVVRALKVDVGMHVRKGQPLITVESPEVGADKARLMAATSRVQASEENFARQQLLQADGITSRKSFLAARQELDAAKSEQAALSASLSVFATTDPKTGTYTLFAPISGTVTVRSVSVGKLVTLGELLLEVVDTSAMWADIEVAEGDLSRISVGDAVQLRIEGLGEREVTGNISYIAPAIDPHTRTAIARVALSNEDGSLRANMFGQARIAGSHGATSLVVPRVAVQRVKDVSLVFVRVSAVEYEARRVKLASSDADFVEITQGLRAEEQVVTTGAFLLKTETLKDSIGAGCCEGE